MRIQYITSRRSLKVFLIILPLVLTLVALFAASSVSAQSTSGGLGVGSGDGLEVGINLTALNQLRADINAGMYNRACTAQEHNRTEWHTLVNPVAKCHYDHIHGDDPNYVNDIFGQPGAWFGSPGNSISYPWQTFAAATADEPNTQYVAQGRMENDLKHEGYIWVVRRDQPCPEGDCTTDFRLQAHAIMGAHDMPVRFHSYSLEARVCTNASDPSTCGIIRTGGWQDMGRLFTTAPDFIACNHGIDEIFIPLPADTLYFPIDRPEARDELRCHPNVVTLPPYPSNRPLAEWWGGGSTIRVRFQLRSYDPIGNVDPVDPSRWRFFCAAEDLNCRYDGSIFSVFIGYVLAVPEFWGGLRLDSNGDGRTEFRGYANRLGQAVSNCTTAGLDCVPAEYNNVVLNFFFNKEATYFHRPCEDCARVDHDISPQGQKWITWFYRYANPTMPTPTSMPSEPTSPPPPTPVPTAIPTNVPDPTGPSVIVNVNPTSTNPGNHVTVSLHLENVTDVYGLQSECTVDASVLIGDAVSGGDGFNNDNSFFVDSGFKGDDGSWTVAASRLSPHPAISGSMVAYSLFYIAQAQGSTPVNCTVLAVNSNGQEIPLQVINGSYGNGVPPQPTEATAAPTEPPTATPVTMEPATATPLPTEPTTEPPTATPEVGVASSITGVVSYQNAPDNAGITVQLLAGETAVNETVTGADGAFAFNDVAAGTYTIRFVAPQHLAATLPVNVDGSGQAIDLGTISLIAGDTDDDGKVDILDATFVGANFDVGVPPAPSNADMNRDAQVNISDLVLVGSNFGQTGPVPME
jgi:hypothetical protein